MPEQRDPRGSQPGHKEHAKSHDRIFEQSRHTLYFHFTPIGTMNLWSLLCCTALVVSSLYQPSDGWCMSRRQAIVAGTGSFLSLPVWADEDETAVSPAEKERRKEELRQRLLERRKLMEASRSSNSRQSYLDLSRQRAVLYNTTFQGVTCPPNIPCI
jgi:hypothetical protein